MSLCLWGLKRIPLIASRQAGFVSRCKSTSLAASAPMVAHYIDSSFQYLGYCGEDALNGFAEEWMQSPAYRLSTAQLLEEFKAESGRLCELVEAAGGQYNHTLSWNVCLALATISVGPNLQAVITREMVTPGWVELMEHMAHEAELDTRIVEGFTGQEIYQLLCLFGHLQVRLGPNVLQLAISKLLESGMGGCFTAAELVDLATIMAFYQFANSDFIIMIGQRLMHRHVLPTMGPSEITALTVALCELQVKNEFLMEVLTIRIALFANDFTGLQIAQICGAFAKTPFRHEGMMNALANHVAALQLKAGEMAAVCGAFAALGLKYDSLMSHLAARAIEDTMVTTFSPQDAATMLMAFATMDIKNEQLVQAMVQQFHKGIGNGTVTLEALSDIAWSLSKFDIKEDHLLQQAGDLLLSSDLSGLTAESMRKIYVGFAHHQIKGHPLLERMANTAVQPDLLLSFNAAQMTDILGSLNTVGLRHEGLLRLLMAQAMDEGVLQTFTAPEVANFVCTLATFEIEQPRVMAAMANQAMRPHVLEQFDEKAMDMVVWAYNSTGMHHPGLLQALQQGQKKRQKSSALSSMNVGQWMVWSSGAMLAFLGMTLHL